MYILYILFEIPIPFPACVFTWITVGGSNGLVFIPVLVANVFAATADVSMAGIVHVNEQEVPYLRLQGLELLNRGFQQPYHACPVVGRFTFLAQGYPAMNILNYLRLLPQYEYHANFHFGLS